MACLQYRQLKYQLAKCCYTEETAIPLKLYTKTYMYLEIVVNIKKVPQVLYKVKNDNKSKFYYNWNTKVTRYTVFTAVTIKIAISKMLLDLNKTAVPLKLYTNTFLPIIVFSIQKCNNRSRLVKENNQNILIYSTSLIQIKWHSSINQSW